MRFALSVPPFTDPAAIVALARRAEANGWDGFFLWDHLRFELDLFVNLRPFLSGPPAVGPGSSPST